nr:hypothetical protein [Paraglaciecola sp. 20A4]
MLFINTSLSAKSYVPTSLDTVVSKWTAVIQIDSPREKVASLLAQANMPGLASRSYGQASALTEQLLDTSPKDRQLLFYKARIAQHYHRFDKAIILLNDILRFEPNHASALLLKANILLVQGNLAQAKRTCLQLLGVTELWISGACALEVNAQEGKGSDNAEVSYVHLQSLMQNRSSGSHVEIEQQLWLTQILAELAAKQGLYDIALKHLLAFDLTQVPVSYLVLWADIQLAKDSAHQVMKILGPIVEQADSFDDALLLRLALAEQQISKKTHVWAQRLSQRISVRLQRQDTAHAADIARYYLDISPDRKKALFWAKINWQHARLDADKRLLERAMNVQYNTQDEPQQPAGI